MDKREIFAMVILHGLMMRHSEDAYSDEAAIAEAFRLADVACEVSFETYTKARTQERDSE